MEDFQKENDRSLKELFEDFTFVDGLPFGTKVEE